MNSCQGKVATRKVGKYFWTLLALACGCFVGGVALAKTGDTSSMLSLGGVSNQIRSNFSDVAKLITAAAYIAGFGFAFTAILKFKAHKDNPTQIPVGTPIALLFIAAALIFLPSIFAVGGRTVFGSQAQAGGISGTSIVPGMTSGKL